MDLIWAGVDAMKKRDSIKKMTRKKIERLMAKAKKTWVSMNETLKDGKWDKKDKNKDEEL